MYAAEDVTDGAGETTIGPEEPLGSLGLRLCMDGTRLGVELTPTSKEFDSIPDIDRSRVEEGSVGLSFRPADLEPSGFGHGDLRIQVEELARAIQRQLSDEARHGGHAVRRLERRVALSHVGVHVARMQRHDRDIALAQLNGQRTGHHVERSLGGPVAKDLIHRCCLGCAATDTSQQRRQLDDEGGAMGLRGELQVGQQCARDEERSDGVDLELAHDQLLGRRTSFDVVLDEGEANAARASGDENGLLRGCHVDGEKRVFSLDEDVGRPRAFRNVKTTFWCLDDTFRHTGYGVIRAMHGQHA
ncbi:hypothetical protein ON010_g17257 [Phytophthora cinnamomi]|nr:hypothetical protein ON010_g17257 [Phytophthora cinnamomi]